MEREKREILGDTPFEEATQQQRLDLLTVEHQLQHVYAMRTSTIVLPTHVCLLGRMLASGARAATRCHPLGDRENARAPPNALPSLPLVTAEFTPCTPADAYS